MHSVLSYSTYNIPLLTEYIPVFPAKGLDYRGDCRAGHIRLHSATCLRHCEVMGHKMVYKCGPNFIGTAWCLHASRPLPPILPPHTLTPPPPLLPLPKAGSCPCSFTWPGASMFRNCTSPSQALYIHVWQHSQSWTAPVRLVIRDV